MNILIPGAGGPSGLNLIKLLKKVNWKGKIISVDCDKYASGFFLSDKYYVIPKTKDLDNFDECIKRIIKDNIFFYRDIS